MLSSGSTQVFSWSIPQTIGAVCRTRHQLHHRFSVEEQTMANKFLQISTGNQLEQHFHATETVGNDKDDVFVWEIAGRLAVSLDIPSNLPLCDGSEGVNTVQEQYFRAAKMFGDTLEVRRVVQVATHSEPGTLRFPRSRATGCTVFVDGVSQRYD